MLLQPCLVPFGKNVDRGLLIFGPSTFQSVTDTQFGTLACLRRAPRIRCLSGCFAAVGSKRHHVPQFCTGRIQSSK